MLKLPLLVFLLYMFGGIIMSSYQFAGGGLKFPGLLAENFQQALLELVHHILYNADSMVVHIGNISGDCFCNTLGHNRRISVDSGTEPIDCTLHGFLFIRAEIRTENTVDVFLKIFYGSA